MFIKNIFHGGFLSAGIFLVVFCIGCQNSGNSENSGGAGWQNPFASKESKRIAAEKEAETLLADAEKSFRNKNNLEARAGYLKLLAYYDEHPEVKRDQLPYCRLGLISEDLKAYDQAEKYYRDAIALDEKKAEPYNNLGFCMFSQRKYEEAIRWLEKATECDPAEKKYHNNLGLAYGAINNYAKAFEHFRLAMPEADAYYNLSSIFAMQGKENEAVLALKQALTADPTHKNAARMLAVYDEYNRHPEYYHNPNDYRQNQPGGLVNYQERMPAPPAEMSQAPVSGQYGAGYQNPGPTYQAPGNQGPGYQNPGSGYQGSGNYGYPY